MLSRIGSATISPKSTPFMRHSILQPDHVKAKSKYRGSPTSQPAGARPFLHACAYKSCQAVEHGIEQRAKAHALIEAGEDRGGLLLERTKTYFVGGTFQKHPQSVSLLLASNIASRGMSNVSPCQ